MMIAHLPNFSVFFMYEVKYLVKYSFRLIRNLKLTDAYVGNSLKAPRSEY